eukprot:gene4580-9102_t
MQENIWSPPMNLDGSGGIVISGHPGMPGAPYSMGKRLWRKGKWTDEEEKYTKRLISAFNQGLLSLSAGTTLRCFLSEKLNCDPMRISKKFAGSSCIGKQVYNPCDPTPETTELMKSVQDEINHLEELFLAKVEVSEKTMYPAGPAMWYGDTRAMQPFMYSLPPEYISPMPTMVVPYNGMQDVMQPSPDMYMRMGMGMQSSLLPVPMSVPQNVGMSVALSHPPPPEPKESRRNFIVPEMKQIPEVKQVPETKQEADTKETSDVKQTFEPPISTEYAVSKSNNIPPLVAEGRDSDTKSNASQDKQQLEILEIPPLGVEQTTQSAQPKHNAQQKDSKKRHCGNGNQTGDEATDLLINFFKAANDRDSVETSDSSSNSTTLEGKSDSSNNGNSGEEKSSDSSNHGGNSGSDGDNSSQEEESSGAQDKSESSSQDDQHNRSRSRGKITIPASESESDRMTAVPMTTMRTQHPHNRRYYHSAFPQHHQVQQAHHLPSYPPYPHSQHYQPQYAQHGMHPQYQHMAMPMHNVLGQYGVPAEQMMAMGGHGHPQQAAAWRGKSASAGMQRPRPAAPYGTTPQHMAGNGGGTVIDTPNGPLYVWHEMNGMGALVEKAVPLAFMTAPYRAGKERSMPTMMPMQDDRMLQRRFTDRAERRNAADMGLSSNKRLKTEGIMKHENGDMNMMTSSEQDIPTPPS